MTAMGFDYQRPDNLERAVALLALPESIVLAGGQSLVPLLNARKVRPRHVIDVSRIAELRHIELDGATLRIGAAVRLADIERHEALALFPLLAAALASTASPAIRNRATLVGNLVRANAASELAVAVVALDATLSVAHGGSRRTIPAADFVLGHHRSAVASGDLVVSLEVPRPAAARTGSAFREVGVRAGSPPLACVAVRIEADAAGVISAARVVAGGITGRPARCGRTEAALIGRPVATAAGAVTPEALAPAAELPNADYALDVLPVLIERALEAAGATLGPSPAPMES